MEQKKIEQLVKKAMKRDEDALEVLLSQYQEYLYRIAYAYYKNEQEALDKLSPDYRKVLILRYFQDMKIKEIGEVMQIPEGTAKVMIHRARKILQRILVEEMGYEESNV